MNAKEFEGSTEIVFNFYLLRIVFSSLNKRINVDDGDDDDHDDYYSY